MVPTAFQFPPLDCSLLFPELVGFHMERNPSFPMFVFTSESASGALVEISFLEFGQAAHRVARVLRPSRYGPDGEVVMVIANTDTILYHAVVAGLSVAGWVPFPVSPRNSALAVADMMKKTSCSRIVTLDHLHKGLVDGIRRESEGVHLTVHELPTLRDVFPKPGEVAAEAFIPYPPAPKRPELDSPAIYMHSSGSTGFPKPIAHTHRILIQWLAHPLLGVDAEFPLPRRVGAMALPPFHASGIVTQLYIPIAFLVTAVVYHPCTEKDPLAYPTIPTSDNILDCLRKTKCNVLITVPTFLEQMATSKEAIEVLKNVDAVRFGGGPLAIKVGEKLWSAGVQLASCYSGTEFGPIAMPSRQDIADGDWMWVRFLDDVKIRWAPQGDDTYELQVLSTQNRQMAVENIRDVKGYATADVFERHPTKDMWRIVGRADDVIVLASGEKTVPAPMESVIGSSPLVQGVVMFGRERNQVGVLIEPRPEHAIDANDEKAVAEFRNQIWPVIEEVNISSPTFSRIFKGMILITSHDKPMLRVAKGTVQRKATLDAYEEDINVLYRAYEESSVASDGLGEPSAWTNDVLEDWLLKHACATNQNHDIDPSADLFAQGFDSLNATYLRNRILGTLRKSTDPEINKAATRIPLNVIFQNPTIQLLSSRIAALVNNNNIEQSGDFIQQHIQAIDAMIQKYSVGLGSPDEGILPSSELVDPVTVLLTGSTGGLGSFLLSGLLKNPAVCRVFALNRPSLTQSVEERQRWSLRDRGLPADVLNSNKLVYVEADASSEKCGLSTPQYEEIRDSLTLIIHNAWRLDFNLAVSSFEDSIRASRNLIDLGLSSPRKKNLRFLFTSSIGSAQSWDNAQGPLPEEAQLDPSTAIGTGYGEGKYATERLILKSGLHATSLRIGQIVGGLGESWATSDWFPIIVKSSIALGALPEAAGVVSWARQEDVVAAILETAFSREAPPSVLNISNPRHASWIDIIAFVRRSIIKRKELGNNSLPIISLGEWFALLQNKAENTSEGDLAVIPAIKLLEFFRKLALRDEVIRSLGNTATEVMGMPNVSTAKAERISPTMANMQPIGEAEADAWVEYWISKGTF